MFKVIILSGGLVRRHGKKGRWPSCTVGTIFAPFALQATDKECFLKCKFRVSSAVLAERTLGFDWASLHPKSQDKDPQLWQ